LYNNIEGDPLTKATAECVSVEITQIKKNRKLCQEVKKTFKEDDKRNEIVFFENANLFFQMFFSFPCLNFIIIANDYSKYFNCDALSTFDE
jgi:hypothetical protein